VVCPRMLKLLVEWKRLPKLFQFLASKGISDKHGRSIVIKSTQSRGAAYIYYGDERCETADLLKLADRQRREKFAAGFL